MEFDTAVLSRHFPWIHQDGVSLTTEAVTSTLLSKRGFMPLGALFPAIPVDAPLARLSLGARIENLLAEQHATTFEALAEHSLDDIAGWRNVGAGSLTALVSGLVAAVVALPMDGVDVETAASGTPEWIRSLTADIETIARWHRLLGADDIPLLGGLERHEEPRDVRAARARLLTLTAATVLPASARIGEAASLVERMLDGFGEREVRIVRDRIVADDPATLDELGTVFEVTRERIRQLESKLIATLRDRIKSGELGALAVAVRDAVGVVLPLRSLLQRLPTLAEHVPDLGQPVWRVLDRLDDTYEILDGWCASGTVADAIVATKTRLLRESANGRFIELASVDSSDELSDEWLEYSGIHTLAGYAFLGRANIPDRAEVLLHRQQAPLKSSELHARLGVERSLTALKNALSSDARFDRVNRDEWALSAWGLEGYEPIHALIGRALSANGGSVRLEDLIAELTERFDVSPKSVVAYASGFPYTTDQGVVRHRTRRDMRNRPRGKGLVKTRAMFRMPSDVRLRVVVSNEHMRGSGSSLPNAIGEELDFGIGEIRDLVTDDGTVQLSRPRAQILLGSIRSELQRRNVNEGDMVYFVFGADGTFRVDLADCGNSAVERIAALAGGAIEAGGLFEALAGRIDADGVEKETVRNALAARGDAELVELIDIMSTVSGFEPAVEPRLAE